MSRHSFISELRRRNVHRAAVFYAGAAWLLVQVATQVFPFFDIPNGVVRWVVIATVIGFPFALLFSWFYEWTPQGIKLESEIDHAASITRHTGKAIDRWIIAVLSLAVVLLLAKSLMPRDPTASVSASTVGKSIAVLPFENLSAEADNAYFATGMQDEILTRLAGIRDLKVISRTSTAQYASHPPNLRVVGQQLGVATVLEGSVQRAGGKVRINLQLIDAQTDSHLWAQNYDRDLQDVFAVQSDVASQVADALKAQLLPAESAQIAGVPTTSVQAHDLYLRGLYLFGQLQSSSVADPVATGREAATMFRQAIAADAGFVSAYAWLSYLYSYLNWYRVDSDPGVPADARANAEKALALEPQSAVAHLAMGYVRYWGQRDYAAALRELERARAGLPNSAEALAAIGYVKRRQGDVLAAVEYMQQASALDPRNAQLPREIAASYVTMGRYDEADAAYARSLAILPTDVDATVQRASGRMYAGDTAMAERILAAVPAELDPLGMVSLMRFRLQMLLRKPDAALAAIEHAPDWLAMRFDHSAMPISLLRGQALAMQGKRDAARENLLVAQTALKAAADNPVTAIDALSLLAQAEAGLGHRDAALQAGREASERLPIARDSMVGAFLLERLARTEAQVGETAAAIGHLQQILDSSSGGASLSRATLRLDPAWDPLRQDARFQKLASP